MDTDDKMWEKKYPAFIVNKCLHLLVNMSVLSLMK